MEQVIHVYDVARYLMGEPKVVFCQMENLFHRGVENYTIEDVSATTIRFENGAVGSIIGSNCAIPRKWIARWRVITERLTVEFWEEGFESANNATFYFTALPHTRRWRVESDKDIYRAESEDLLEAIRTGRATRVPISEGVKTLKFVLATAESAEKGEPIEID